MERDIIVDSMDYKKGDMIGNYIITKKIKGGQYGFVYEAVHVTKNFKVAIKVMKKQADEQGLSPATIREIGIIKDMSHENIINLIELIYHSSNISIVLELCDGDLDKLISIHESLDLSLTKVR